MISAQRWLPLVLVVVLVAGYPLVRIQQRVDARLQDFRVEEQMLYLSSGEWVKRLALGYDGLLACLYWTRAVQHYGRERLGPKRYQLLYNLLDITTSLDPQLLLAYRYGAIFLTELPPSGPGRPDLAIKLLQKGIENNPDYWRFWYDLGFVYYRSLEDYQLASEAFLEGSQHPNANAWMKVMAAKIAAEGGDRQTARFLWQELYNSTDDPALRQNAFNHLRGLQVDDEVEYLQALLQRYRQQTGRRAESFQELVAAGWLREWPTDPTGHPYFLVAGEQILLHEESPIDTSEKGRRE